MALAVIESLEFDTTIGLNPEIIHISGDIYAIIYAGVDGDGFLKTVAIDSEGDIGSIIDTLEFDTGNCVYSHIIHISGDVYAIAYEGVDAHGWLVTVDIDSAGNIADTVIDSHEFDTSKGEYPFIIHISGTTYAIAYIGPDGDGWLKTLTIANDGTIAADPELDSLEFDTGYAGSLSMVHISGDIYAIAYAGYDATTKYDNRVVTVDINSAGAIEDSVVDTLQIIPPGSPSLGAVSTGRIVHVVGDVYAFVGKADNADLTKKIFLYTVTISGAGAISDAVVDSLELATGDLIPDLIKLSGRHYAVAYQGLGSDGFLKTITIEENGTIGSVVDTLEFDPSYCGSAPHILGITEEILAIAYRGPDSDGWLKTIGGVEVVPTVTTNPATSVGTTIATLNGTLDDDGGEACDCGFEWGETIAYGKTTPTQSRTTGQTFAQTITGLDPNKTYHFRAFATNSAGTGYGADRTFTTPVAIGEVTTDEATNVKETSATLNGTLDDDGGEACEVRFQYGFTTDYGTNTAWQPGKETRDTFSQPIVELVGGNLYHFRAQAKNSAGTANGNDRTLATITPFMAKRAYALAREEL